MIILQVHNYQHRLLNSGILESAEVFEDGTVGEFSIKGDQEMNLSGGDVSLIRECIERLSFSIPADYRLPFANEKKQKETVVEPV